MIIRDFIVLIVIYTMSSNIYEAILIKSHIIIISDGVIISTVYDHKLSFIICAQSIQITIIYRLVESFIYYL